MSERKVIVYCGMSLDGFIAGPEGDLSFLDSMQVEGEDYGWNAFISTVDTMVMGRKTYDKVLSFGIPWPHKERHCIVMSRTRTGKDENVHYFNGTPEELVAELRAEKGGDIYVDGGLLINAFMQADLVDRFIISVIPVLLGGGIPLFHVGRPTQGLKLKSTQTFPSGLVSLSYDRIREAEAPQNDEKP